MQHNLKPHESFDDIPNEIAKYLDSRPDFANDALFLKGKVQRPEGKEDKEILIIVITKEHTHYELFNEMLNAAKRKVQK